jgi:hypothetical protein
MDKFGNYKNRKSLPVKPGKFNMKTINQYDQLLNKYTTHDENKIKEDLKRLEIQNKIKDMEDEKKN